MIDVDRFEEQLDLALTDELRTAIGLTTVPRPVAPPPPAGRPRQVARERPPRRSARVAAPSGEPQATGANDISSLIRAGRLQDADRLIAEQQTAAQNHGTARDRRDAALWSTMQALRDGRIEDARAGTLSVRVLSEEAGDPCAVDRFWGQRFWVVLDWGNDAERYELLDQCRERAYAHDDISWRSALALLCARLGRTGEAKREFDATAARQQGTEADGVGIVTNLAEAAALLGDPQRAGAVQQRLAAVREPVVFDGHMCVIRGAVARHQALIAATNQQWPEADRAFQAAVDNHRSIGALPLIARTLYEWALTLAGRGDPRAWDFLTESTSLARGLHMTGPIAGMP